MPETVRQTTATRQAARTFGIVSRKGKLIRRAIVPHLDIRYNGALVNRLNQALLKAGQGNEAAGIVSPGERHQGREHLRYGQHYLLHQRQTRDQFRQHQSRRQQLKHQQLQHLAGFRFNPYTGIEKLFPQAPIFTPQGVLQIPAQQLSAAGNASHLEVRALAIRISFEERCMVAMDENTALVDLNMPFDGLQLPLSAPGKGILFIVLQARACTLEKNNRVSAFGDRRYMAADIITVVGPSQPKNKKEKTFLQGAYLKRHVQYVDQHRVNDTCLSATSTRPYPLDNLPPAAASRLE